MAKMDAENRINAQQEQPEPAAEETAAAPEQDEPAAEPVEAAVEPAEPAAEQTEPDEKPEEPAAEEAEPAVEQTEANEKPEEPAAEEAEPAEEQAEAEEESGEAETEQTEATEEPAAEEGEPAEEQAESPEKDGEAKDTEEEPEAEPGEAETEQTEATEEPAAEEAEPAEEQAKTEEEAEKPAAAAAKPADPLKKKLLCLIAALVGAAVLIPVVNEFIPQKVVVKVMSLDGVKTVSYGTTKHTVAEFMKENEDDFGERDIVRADDDAFITNNMEIGVLRGKRSGAKIKGQNTDFYLYKGSVGDNLKFNGVEFDENDIVRPAAKKTVKPGTKIVVKDVRYVTKTKVERIKPREKSARFDKDLESGEIRRTKGKAGKGRFVYRYKYVNGKKVSTTRKLKKVIRKPVHIGLVFGTSETGQTGRVRYKETFIGECTAYYSGANATGAIGQRCHYGTCAVDPDVIPYGTKLYIEDYGFAVANDCGGAVKGHIIDLYMHSTAECIRWGRRDKKVYVLK